MMQCRPLDLLSEGYGNQVSTLGNNALLSNESSQLTWKHQSLAFRQVFLDSRRGSSYNFSSHVGTRTCATIARKLR